MSAVSSLSARRAWIEIALLAASSRAASSLSARRAWIEMDRLSGGLAVLESLSARRAWIEIWHRPRSLRRQSVALRKESVDRNKNAKQDIALDNGSLSARRAWIEIRRTKQWS